MGAKIPHRLCRTCPFKPGHEREGWLPGARTRLYKGKDDLSWLMECHTTSETACHGFLATVGHEFLGVRLAVIRRRLELPPPIPGGASSLEELDRLCEGAENWD